MSESSNNFIALGILSISVVLLTYILLKLVKQDFQKFSNKIIFAICAVAIFIAIGSIRGIILNFPEFNRFLENLWGLIGPNLWFAASISLIYYGIVTMRNHRLFFITGTNTPIKNFSRLISFNIGLFITIFGFVLLLIELIPIIVFYCPAFEVACTGANWLTQVSSYLSLTFSYINIPFKMMGLV
jgi:hypothetical protein